MYLMTEYMETWSKKHGGRKGTYSPNIHGIMWDHIQELYYYSLQVQLICFGVGAESWDLETDFFPGFAAPINF